MINAGVVNRGQASLAGCSMSHTGSSFVALSCLGQRNWCQLPTDLSSFWVQLSCHRRPLVLGLSSAPSHPRLYLHVTSSWCTISHVGPLPCIPHDTTMSWLLQRKQVCNSSQSACAARSAGYQYLGQKQQSQAMMQCCLSEGRWPTTEDLQGPPRHKLVPVLHTTHVTNSLARPLPNTRGLPGMSTPHLLLGLS